MPGAPIELELRTKPSHIMRIMMRSCASPSAQAPEHGVPRGLLVEMHGLRIELCGKSDDFLARDHARAVIVTAPGSKSSK